MTGAEIRAAIRARFPEAVLSEEEGRDMDTVVVDPQFIVPLCTFLRDDPELDFKMLTDLTAIDWSKWPDKKDHTFEVLTLLWSVQKLHRIRLKFPLSDEGPPEIDTLCGVYKVANWLEREAYDMYGIGFKGHPNLRRILTHPEFEGHPLRKSYPVNRRQPIRPPETDILTAKPYTGTDHSN